MASTPFLFFNHGTEIDLERMDKNEELFIWFTRPVTKKERKLIETSAPMPVRGLFAWGECFAYFGSGGDTYDFDIVEAYAPKEARALNALADAEEEDDEDAAESGSFDDLYASAMRTAVPSFLAAFEAWAKATHAIVPVAFVQGPWVVDEPSKWGRESAAALPEAIARVLAFARGTSLDRNADSNRYLGYIVRGLAENALQLDVALDADARLSLIEALYLLDELRTPYDRLTSDEHTNLANAKQVSAFLSGVAPAERRTSFARLSAYAQLAYLASYDALKLIVPALVDLPAAVAALLEAVPKERAAIAPSLVMHLANNLCHVAPAYTKPVHKDAARAAAIMELAAKSASAKAEMFTNGSMFWLWAKQPKRALALAVDGHAKFPKDAGILRNAVAAANELEQFDVAKKYSAVAAKLEKAPDVNRVLNESYALLRAGKLEDGLKCLRAYVEAGGADDARVWTNVISCHTNIAPDHALYDAARAKADFAKVRELIENKREFAASVELVENLVIAYGNHGFTREAVALVDARVAALLATENGRAHFPSIIQSYTWSGVLTDDAALRQHVKERFEAIDREHAATFDAHPASLDNMASVYCKLGDRKGMFRMLERLKKVRYDGLAVLVKDPHLAAMHDDPEFKAFFAKLR